jgi:hypothetical protein
VGGVLVGCGWSGWGGGHTEEFPAGIVVGVEVVVCVIEGLV